MPFLRNNFNSKNKKKIWKKSFPISLAASDKCAWNCKLSANARRNLDLSFKVPKKAKIPKRKKNRFDINSNRVAKAKSVINIHEIHNSHVQHGAHFEIQLMTCGREAVGGEEGGCGTAVTFVFVATGKTLSIRFAWLKRRTGCLICARNSLSRNY